MHEMSPTVVSVGHERATKHQRAMPRLPAPEPHYRTALGTRHGLQFRRLQDPTFITVHMY